jgi:peptide/nickel transport system ATP-binding protein
MLADVDADLHAGRVLAVVGPSGAGKTTLGLGLLGEAAPGITLSGSVLVDGTELLVEDPRQRRARRAGRVGHLPQHPGAVLDPVRRVGRVLDELAATVYSRDRGARHSAVREALRLAGVPEGEGLERRFPHQLSGGQQQRMALAQTLVTAPRVLVLDEPTTGLDGATTEVLVDNLARVAAAGVALVLLTHDHGIARELAHEALELHDGRVHRYGPADSILREQTRVAPAAAPSDEHPRLRARDLRVVTSEGRALLENVAIDAGAGQCVAVVGPSGAGKTTLGRCLAGLIVPREGAIEVDGRTLPAGLTRRDRDERRLVQYVHQDPRATFLPRRAVLDQVARPGVLLQGMEPIAARAEARTLLKHLGVDHETAARRPRALSGGQLQRAAVARALLADPAVLVADEVTSALDTDRQAELLDAIDRVRRERDTSIVLISHNIDLVAAMAATTTVLDRGRVTDHGRTADVLARRAQRAPQPTGLAKP